MTSTFDAHAAPFCEASAMALFAFEAIGLHGVPARVTDPTRMPVLGMAGLLGR